MQDRQDVTNGIQSDRYDSIQEEDSDMINGAQDDADMPLENSEDAEESTPSEEEGGEETEQDDNHTDEDDMDTEEDRLSSLPSGIPPGLRRDSIASAFPSSDHWRNPAGTTAPSLRWSSVPSILPGMQKLQSVSIARSPASAPPIPRRRVQFHFDDDDDRNEDQTFLGRASIQVHPPGQPCVTQLCTDIIFNLATCLTFTGFFIRALLSTLGVFLARLFWASIPMIITLLIILGCSYFALNLLVSFYTASYTGVTHCTTSAYCNIPFSTPFREYLCSDFDSQLKQLATIRSAVLPNIENIYLIAEDLTEGKFTSKRHDFAFKRSSRTRKSTLISRLLPSISQSLLSIL